MKTIALVLATIVSVIVIGLVVIFATRKPDSQGSPFSQGPDNADYQSSIELGLNRLKPHFLNNILTTIYYLCDTDSGKAQALTATFSEYLLGSIEALKTNDTVSFAWELGLIRNYLALEKVRLEDKLSIDYDVDINDFKVPALSVLMLVERMVKHGIAGLEKGGTVKISTRRLAGGLIQIKVTGDGDAINNHDKKNAEELRHDFDTMSRLLKKQSKGELSIINTENGGTEATIIMRP